MTRCGFYNDKTKSVFLNLFNKNSGKEDFNNEGFLEVAIESWPEWY